MNSRVVLLPVSILLILLAGCARSLSPDRSTATRSSASIPAPARLDGAGFQAVLTIVGTTVTLDGNGDPVLHPDQLFQLSPVAADDYSYADTVPVGSTIRSLRWRPQGGASLGLDRDPADAPLAGERDTTLSSGPLSPGPHTIQVTAPRRAGGGTVTFRFFVDFAPDSWWAGPVPELWPASSDGDGRAVDVTDWRTFTTSPAWPPDGRGYFGPDSFRWIPAKRQPPGNNVERRTFYELYGNRIYARSEGDTVHLNSWLVVCNGGYDKDSKYLPHVVPTDPGLPAGYQSDPDAYRALIPDGLLGSPVGYRTKVTVLTDDGRVVPLVQSALYPRFDPASVFRAPTMVDYWPARTSGKWYVMGRTEDAEGLIDPRASDPRAVADHVDAGVGTPEERALRHRIVVFYVRSGTSAARAAALSPPGYSGSAPRRDR